MKTYNRVLVTGANGQLAQALARFAPAESECIGLTRIQLDIADRDAVARIFDDVKPDVVINGAAYNLVDKAETDGQGDALRVNAQGVAALAEACKKLDIPLVHFSTDFVFDGEKTTPYTESDCPRPLGVYAASKLAGEQIALASSTRNLAIRVCRVFGPLEHGGSTQKPAGNFPLLMMKLGRERDLLRVVNDQVGTPSHTHDLARGVWQLVQNEQAGLFHLSNEGEVAFDEYAREVFRLTGINCEVESISSEEYGAPAKRPLYSTLSNDKAHSAGVTPLRHWKDALREFVI
ncbi:MAG TPA: dTDP-4-dehydrorhamnose reductase [Abditibacteriaceae bacterium]|jgi:dTDP-4-dehydrorhamnose reductase|nr:dTDP-4-dehydrorhamnose reductase [Abditibacteriaceae bacterium]